MSKLTSGLNLVMIFLFVLCLNSMLSNNSKIFAVEKNSARYTHMEKGAVDMEYDFADWDLLNNVKWLWDVSKYVIINKVQQLKEWKENSNHSVYSKKGSGTQLKGIQSVFPGPIPPDPPEE